MLAPESSSFSDLAGLRVLSREALPILDLTGDGPGVEVFSPPILEVIFFRGVSCSSCLFFPPILDLMGVLCCGDSSSSVWSPDSSSGVERGLFLFLVDLEGGS